MRVVKHIKIIIKINSQSIKPHVRKLGIKL